MKSGWWYAMDSDGEWWVSEKQPELFGDSDVWKWSGIGMYIPDNVMPTVPNDIRASEACWQVE